MTTGIFGSLYPAPIAERENYWWLGRSGFNWITTIYPLFYDFADTPAVYLMVRRNWDGTRSPIYIGQTDSLRRRMMEHTKDKLARAYRLGANELHVHLLAETENQRLLVENDLRNRHPTPINEQPSAVLGGLFGLYRASEQKRLLGQVGTFR